MFYRLNDDGNAVLFHEDGSVVTQLPNVMPCVFTVNGDLSAYWEHAEGIVLTVEGANKCGIYEEMP